MCTIDGFNLSHASMTSPEALLALRELPRTNPTLYDEISANRSVGEESNEVEEDAFSPERRNDGSMKTDIPMRLCDRWSSLTVATLATVMVLTTMEQL